MILSQGLVGIRYIRKLLAFKSYNIKIEGGIAIPTELWDMIIEFAVLDTQNSYCLIQGVALQKLSNVEVLQCHRVGLNSGSYCGYLNSADEVYDLEEFMMKPNQYASETTVHPTPR
jgi:hypothetical protein